MPDNKSVTGRTTVPCYCRPTLALRRDNESVAGRTTMLTRWRGNKRVAGRMTVPWLCGPSPTCWLSWQRGGGRCSLIVLTQVGGWADDGALALLSVPCLLVQQRRLVGVDDSSSALWAIPDWLAELAAGRRTMLACCCNTSWRLGGQRCRGIVVCPLLTRATAVVAGWTMMPWHHLASLAL